MNRYETLEVNLGKKEYICFELFEVWVLNFSLREETMRCEWSACVSSILEWMVCVACLRVSRASVKGMGNVVTWTACLRGLGGRLAG